MSLIVFSKNSYLQVALSVLHDEGGVVGNIGIIDISSFNSLNELIHAIHPLYTTNEPYRVILLGGQDMYSRILHPLGVKPMKASINSLIVAMKTGVPPLSLLEFITECRSLTALTSKELSSACSLRGEKSLIRAARRLRVNEKTFYNQIGKVATKLNLRSGKDLLIFLNQEFRCY